MHGTPSPRGLKPALLLFGLLFLVGSADAFSAQAGVANGGFEECAPAAEAPNKAWTLRGGLLPAGWQFNALYGGQAEIVGNGHASERALSLEGTGELVHMYQPPMPVKTGDILQLSAWVRQGTVELTFYEYAESGFLRTVPSVAVITAGDEWAQGGGYHHVSDPRVTAVAMVVAVTRPGRALVDDVEMQPVPFERVDGDDVVLENRGCRLTLGADGRRKSFFDKTLGEERGAGGAAPFFGAVAGNWQLPVTRLERKGNVLQVTFGAGRAHAAIEVQERPYYLGLILKSWDPPDLARLTLFDMTVGGFRVAGTSAGVAYDERAAVGLQTLHYAGSQEAQATPRTLLLRCAFPGSRGLEKAGCAFLACPRPRLEETVREIEAAYGLPSPEIDGVWGKRAPLMKRSYFFVHDLSEANVDEVIAWGRRGHFGYIQILEDAWCRGGGTFAVNEKNFPHGLDGLKSVVDRLHAAGFKVGLHFLAAGVRGTDPLVSPVPNSGLHYAAETPLAAGIDAGADFIPTAAPPRGFPEKDGGYEGSGTFLRVDDEIVWYRAVKLDPPYGFAGCQRGALNSAPAAHAAGARARHMMRSWGLFLIDADSPLLDEVAENLARVFRHCGCDGLYMDGCERLQGEQDYYNARIQMAYASRCGLPGLICQASSYSPYAWHLVSRHASADGYRDVKAYLDKRSPAFVSWYDANLMPIDIGWYGLNSEIRPDDMEYVCSRAVGFGASVSLSTSMENLKTVPQAGEIVDNLARWEDLRLSGKVPEAVRARLREPGREYRLAAGGEGETLLIPVEYSAWSAAGRAGGEDAVAGLEVRNGRDRPAALELQLECAGAAGAEKPALKDPAVRVGGREFVFKVTMSPGDRLVCRGAGDCRLYRPGSEGAAVEFDAALPAVEPKGSLTVTMPEASRTLQVRAALSWPDLAVRIPRR